MIIYSLLFLFPGSSRCGECSLQATTYSAQSRRLKLDRLMSSTSSNIQLYLIFLPSPRPFSHFSFPKANRAVCRQTSDPPVFSLLHLPAVALQGFLSTVVSWSNQALVVDAHQPRIHVSQPASVNVSPGRICRSAAQHFALAPSCFSVGHLVV
jgi:hypothetical protein